MWRTLILVPILLHFLAGPARTEEVEAPQGMDPARVAKLLLSDDEGERERGAALLQERMRRGGDVQTWLVAMARAQAEWADADDRLVERWIDDVLRGAPERARRARRLLAAVGREATQRLLEALKDVKSLASQSGGEPQPQTEEAPPRMPAAPQTAARLAEPQAPRTPIAAPSVPAGWIRARVIEVPSIEIRGRFDDLTALGLDQAVLVETRAAGVFERAAALPEARMHAVAPSQVPIATARDLVLVDGAPVRYRNRARRTKGAWAVETALLRRGLRVSVRLEDEVLEVKARYVTMPDPLPTELVRPAGDVEPLELDRPEWEAATLTLRAPADAARDEVALFFPGLVPDRVVVVSLRLLPVLE